MNFGSKLLVFFSVLFLSIVLVSAIAVNQPNIETHSTSSLPTYTVEPLDIIKDPLFANPDLITTDTLLNVTLDVLDNTSIVDIRLINENATIIFTDFTESIVDQTRIVHCLIEPEVLPGLYSISVNTSVGTDIAWNSVRIFSKFPDNFTVIHLTDVHVGTTSYEAATSLADLQYIVPRINEINPSLVVFTGDIIEDADTGNETKILERYKMALNTLSGLKVPIFMINGNHDLKVGAKEHWETYINPRYQYEFKFNTLAFVLTSIYDESPEGLPSSNVTWLKNKIVANNEKGFTTIFCYHTDYGDQFNNMGADIHFAGHEHQSSIETTPDGATKIVTGKAFYTYSNVLGDQPGEFRFLKFESGELVDNYLEYVNHPLPNISTTSSQVTPTTITMGTSTSSTTSTNISSSGTETSTEDQSESGTSLTNSEPFKTSASYLEIYIILNLIVLVIYRRYKK